MFERLLKTLLQPKGTKQQMPKASPITSDSPAIPHPEEPMNPSATLSNISVPTVFDQWIAGWAVPSKYWEHWKKAVDIQVYDVYPDYIIALGINQDTPAATWEAGGKRHLAVKPGWLNPGVIAHEQAHNSYTYLDSGQKSAFSALYASLKNTEPLIKALYSINKYGLTSDVEGHAEVYRYIGQFMPPQLKAYYPMLF
jgi:hypothetical protein